MRNKKINKDKKYTERILDQAVRIGNLDIVNALLDNGAKINNKKFSPLLSALNSKNFDIAKILILRGADPNLESNDSNPLILACETGNLEIVKLLVQKGARVNCKNKYNITPLSAAIFGSGLRKVQEYTEERKDIIKFLLENKADKNKVYLSSMEISIEQVKFLLEYDIPSYKDRYYNFLSKKKRFSFGRIYHYEKLDISVIKLLIENEIKTNPDYKKVFKSTLSGAINEIHEHKQKKEKEKQAKYIRIAMLLIKTGIGLWDAMEKTILADDLGMFMYMFRTDRAKFLKSPKSDSFVISAVKYEQKEILHFLLKKGFNTNGREDNNRTPLHLAISKLFPVHINFKYLEKEQFAAKLEPVKALLKNDAKINVKDYEHTSPIHFAVMTDIVEVIELLLDSGGDLRERGKFGYSCLHYAAENMCLNSLQFLLQKGMDSNIRDDFGQTPLHVAAFFGKIQAVEILLSYNAEKLAKTDMRRTPLELAKQKGHVEITNILSD